MAEQGNEPQHPIGRQNWGLVIGIGIVTFGALVMVINLFAHKDPILFAQSYQTASLPAPWDQIGQWLGLVVCLAGGAWLLRQLLRSARLGGIPAMYYYANASGEMTKRAYLLLEEVQDALEKCPVPAEKKALLKEQASQVPENVVRLAWKLERLSRIKALAQNDSSVQREATELEADLQAAAKDSLELLAMVPLSLMRLELSHSDTGIDRILAGLRESNRRMRDLAEAYDEVRMASP